MQNQKSDGFNKHPYIGLAEMCLENIKDLVDQGVVFKKIYHLEVFEDKESQKLTLEIIRNLEERLNDEKREYIRLAAIASSDR